MIGVFGFIDKEESDHEFIRYSLNKMAASIPGETSRTVCSSSNIGGLGICFHPSGSAYGYASDKERCISLVMVGDIFNAASLSPKRFKDGGAAGVLLGLYLEDNLNCLKNSDGLFCAAILDEKKRTMHLVTDRYGSFPIHTYMGQKRFLFGTMIHTLIAEGTVPLQPCPTGISQIFTLQRTLGPWTNIKNVRPVDAASIFSIKRHTLKTTKYWHLKWHDEGLSDKEIAVQLADALKQAVDTQTTHNVKSPGLLLSGGLDSRMVLGCAREGTVSSWTTASYAQNPELSIAKQVADHCKSSFHSLLIKPSETLHWHDQTTIENNGLYPSSTSYSSFMSNPANKCDALLTGHGLDYTLRGYYLPARFLNIGGSSTRLPTIRRFAELVDGKVILENLRQGPPSHILNKIIKKNRRNDWWKGLADNFSDTLSPWLQSDQPLNAWDAFILNQVSQHYAFTGMMSVRAKCNLRMPAFDKNMFDIYLMMSPEQRVRGRAVFMAMEMISPELAKMKNANTLFPANLGPWTEIAALTSRAAARRLGIAKRPVLPSAMHSAGSWQDLGELYRLDPLHRKKFVGIKSRLDAISFGLMDCDALALVIDEHLNGTVNHQKLMRQLLTHDTWASLYGMI